MVCVMGTQFTAEDLLYVYKTVTNIEIANNGTYFERKMRILSQDATK